MITDEQRRQGGSLPTAQDIQNYRDSLSGSSGGQYNGWASWSQMMANPGRTPADVAAASKAAEDARRAAAEQAKAQEPSIFEDTVQSLSDTFTAVGDTADSFLDSFLGSFRSEPDPTQQFNPNVGAPTFDAPTDLERNQFVTEEDSNEIIRDLDGTPISSPDSLEFYADQQDTLDQVSIQNAAELRRQQEAEMARQAFDYSDPFRDTPIAAIEDSFQQYAGLSQAQRAGLPFNPIIEDYFQRGGDETGRGFSDYVSLSYDTDPNKIANVQGTFYEVNPPSGVSIINNIAKFIGGKIIGSQAGGFFGDLVFSLGGKNTGAVQGALYADAVGQGLGSFGASKLFENSNVLRDADGNYFINDTITNPFTGEFTSNVVSLEDKTAQTIAFNEAQQKNQSQSDYDASQVGEIVAGSTADTINWRDYRGDTLSLSPQEIVNAAISGIDLPPEVVDAARFSSQLVGGVDPVQAALNVYGDNIVSILPEGYQRPTEAAVRIGLGGENRVAVLGDIYGADFNLDNPMGKAGLKAAEVYDMTGNSEEALGKSLYTYYKEGGSFPRSGAEFNLADFEVPEFLGDINLDVDFSRLKDFGFSVKEAFDALPSVPWPDINGIDIPLDDIDWPKVEAPEGGYDWAELKDKFPDIKLDNLPEGLDVQSIDLGSLDIDLPSIQAGLDFYSKSGVIPTGSEEFASLDSEFELTQDDESLARKLIKTAV